MKCGGGHYQTAKALESSLKEEYPGSTILLVDIFEDWMGKFFGGFFTRCWNTPLQKGYYFISMPFSYFGIPIADVLFYIPLFIASYKAFTRYPLTRILDTQPVGTSAFCLALKWANKLKKRKIRLEKVLTELPTKKAIHFFHPIKLMPMGLKNILDLLVIEPLPKEPDFWKKYPKVTSQQVKIIDPPLRKAFFQLSSHPPLSHPFEVPLIIHNEQDQGYYEKSFPLSQLIKKTAPDHYTFLTPEHAFITTLMLGSQPHSKIIDQYLKKLAELTQKELEKKQQHIVFILGNEKTPGWNQLKKNWLQHAGIPSNFFPLLLSMQDQKTVAALFHSSHQTITRSGGLTSMELMKASRGQVWVHTDIAVKQQPVLRRMPPWEQGNAEVMIEKLGAKVTTPNHLSLKPTLER
jgi:hypothetical protein